MVVLPLGPLNDLFTKVQERDRGGLFPVMTDGGPGGCGGARPGLKLHVSRRKGALFRSWFLLSWGGTQ